jgi:predicted acyltransferase
MWVWVCLCASLQDLLFPWFMFMMGCSMALALKSRQKAQQSRTTMLTQIARRAATLVTLGLLLEGRGVEYESWRLPGVLQYFGFSYLWCALAVVLTGSWDGLPGALASRAAEGGDPDPFKDFRYFWRESAVVAVAPILW